jgi:hypothetical protein
MKTGNTREYANKLLDQLIQFDKEVQYAQYEMGRILSAIEHGKLYDVLGYGSMSAMIEEELSISPNTASSYKTTYQHLKRLHYTQAEAKKLIDIHTFTMLARVLPHAPNKLSSRAIKQKINDLDSVTVAFSLTHAEREYLHEWLIEYGATEKRGRMENTSGALMAILGRERMREAA